jgi:hypothetical protein
VRTLFTHLPVWTESRHVKWTGFLPLDVPVRTQWAQRTESALVVGTRRPLLARRNVLVQTVVAIRTGAVSFEVHTLGHVAQVILVQEFAVFTLLAQAAHPVLAHGAVEAGARLVAVGTVGAERAVALLEGFAERPAGVQAEAELALEEVGEAKVVLHSSGRC